MTHHWLDELESHLKELHQNLEGLKQASSAEREAVIRFDLPEIQKAHRQKFDCLSRIEILEKLKNKLVDDVGSDLPASEKTITSLVERSGSSRSSEILNLLAKTKQAALSASKENESERSYVFHSLQGVEISMKFLNRVLHRDECHYTASGEVNAGSNAGITLKRSL